MNVFRVCAAAAVSLVVLLQAAGPAAADHRPNWWLKMPRVYLPEISGGMMAGNYWEDEEFFEAVEEDYQRKKRKKRVVYYEDDDFDSEFEPIYEPPRKAVKPKVKKKIVAKKSAPIDAAALSPKAKARLEALKAAKLQTKTKTKPQSLSLVSSAEAKPVDTIVTKKPNAVSTGTAQTISVAKSDSKVETKSPTKAIGCTNGADIIAGYGFSTVKPKTCTGASFTFNAKRAEKDYVITLSSATGEITDVKKIN